MELFERERCHVSNKIIQRGREDTGGNKSVIRVNTIDNPLTDAAIELPNWCLK